MNASPHHTPENLLVYYNHLSKLLLQKSATKEGDSVQVQRLSDFFFKLKSIVHRKVEGADADKVSKICNQAKFHLFQKYLHEISPFLKQDMATGNNNSTLNHEQQQGEQLVASPQKNPEAAADADYTDYIINAQEGLFTDFFKGSSEFSLKDFVFPSPQAVVSKSEQPSKSSDTIVPVQVNNNSAQQSSAIDSVELPSIKPEEPASTSEQVDEQDAQLLALLDNETMHSDMYASEDYVLWKRSERVQAAPVAWYWKVYALLSMIFPLIGWIPLLFKNLWFIKDDIVAGVTVGIMLIPQGMAYAIVASLTPIVGLYTAFVPILIYGILGTCRQLSMGPVAMISLMTATAIEELGAETDEERLAYATLLSITVGCMHMLAGALRIGFIVNFISHSVISGFTTAAAFVIMAGQLKYVFGISVPNDKQLWMLLYNTGKNITGFKWQSFLVALVTIAILLFFQYCYLKVKKRTITINRLPSALVVVVIGILLTFILQRATNYTVNEKQKTKEIHGIQIIGSIPAGLPVPTILKIPHFSFEFVQALALKALPIAFIAFMESISLALNFARKEKYEVHTNQELIALGFANVIGGFFKCYPATGGFSRSAVLYNSGAKTQLAGIISSIIVMFTMLFLTPVFYYLPFATLAAIIIVACLRLIDFHEFVHAFKSNKFDFVILLATFLGTVLIGIEEGILVGVGVSIFLVLFNLSTPRLALLGRIPGTTNYRTFEKWTNLVATPGVLIVRLDSDLLYTNTLVLRSFLEEKVKKAAFRVHVVILDMSSVSQIDHAGMVALKEIGSWLKNKSILILIAELKRTVQDKFKSGGLAKLFTKEHIFVEVHDAVMQAKRECALIIKKKMDEEKKKLEEEAAAKANAAQVAENNKPSQEEITVVVEN